MGLNFMEIDPIPHLASPLKGEEQDKLALMRRRERGLVLWCFREYRHFDLSSYKPLRRR